MNQAFIWAGIVAIACILFGLWHCPELARLAGQRRYRTAQHRQAAAWMAPRSPVTGHRTAGRHGGKPRQTRFSPWLWLTELPLRWIARRTGVRAGSRPGGVHVDVTDDLDRLLAAAEKWRADR